MTRKTDILIVDDKTENLLAMESLLEDPEINTITAGSGSEALAKTFEHDFALIVLDVRMPDMDGFEAAELLRSREKTRNIPIIFVTGINKDETHVFKGYEKGAVDYLFKPINPIILKSKVRVFVDLHRQRKTIEVSEKKLAEKHRQLTLSQEALRTSEEKYRLLVEKSGNAVIILQNDRIAFHNRHAEEMTGYTASELSEIPFEDLILPEDREAFASIAATPGLKRPFSIRMINKSGLRLWGEITDALTDWQGNPATLFFIKDITEKTILEERLRQTHKMEAMGSLAGGIAHDFNNIIAAVLGYTEMSICHAPPGSSLHNNLTQVVKAGERARDLVRQILSFSQKRELKKTRIDIRIMVKEALELIRASIPHHISITSRIAPEPAFVYADPTQIHQVVMNLCTNAAHAMEATGGELSIDLQPLPSGSKGFPAYPGLEATACIRLSISDTGAGIDKHTLKRIFEPYFTTKASGQGSGMGLAVVHGIVRACNGAIDVISDPGHGCRVDIYLPDADAQVVRKSAMENREQAVT